MEKKLSLLGLLILFSFLILSAGCNKEKAEAIKIAAENFRIEATSAIKKINYFFNQTISMPSETTEERLKEISNILDQQEVIDAKKLTSLMQDKEIGQRTSEEMNKDFAKIEGGYYQFEAMFRSLPQGSFFARDAVKRAERHAINLTLQLISFAESLQKNPGLFIGRRTMIIDKVNGAKQIKDSDARKKFLTLAAEDMLKLRKEELTIKHEAITQCLKAAESGRLLAKLIREYEVMNVEDILVTVGSSLGFIAEISGGQRDVVALLENYKTIESGIREDPYWKEVLAFEIPK